MKADVPRYHLEKPPHLVEALSWLSQQSQRWIPFAGGTDLMVLMEAGKLPVGNYLSLWHLDELRGISISKGFLRVGALSVFSEIRADVRIQKHFPMLVQAARQTGAEAIQNRATLGGNIANASPAADSPPALLAYDAELELISVRGTRQIKYENFHLDYKKTLLASDELIAAVLLPLRSGVAGETVFEKYTKVGTRQAQSITKVSTAGRMVMNAGRIVDLRWALGAVAAVPYRAMRTEAVIRGQSLDTKLIIQARKTLEQEITPLDDLRSTAEYRRQVAGHLLEQFLQDARQGASP